MVLSGGARVFCGGGDAVGGVAVVECTMQTQAVAPTFRFWRQVL